MSFEQSIAYLAAHPNLLYIVLIIGFYAILFELTHPIVGFIGIGGVCMLTIAFFSFMRLPINPVGPTLMILGIIFFLLEAFLSRYGFLAAAGIAMMGAGSALLFSNTSLKVDYILIIPLTVLTAGITVFLIRAAIRARKAKIMSGPEAMVGQRGSAESDIEPGAEGRVFFQGTLWTAVAENAIRKGEKVQILAIEGMTLKVKKA